jgi:hypothetical protein
MFGNLFIHPEDLQNYDSFSKYIFGLINVEIKEIRYSDNSPGGRYVYGETLGLRVKLEEADDSDFPNYEFLLSFRPLVRGLITDPHCLDGLADIVAKHLAKHRLKIARPLEMDKTGASSVEYGGKDS